MRTTQVKWKDQPEEHDYPAALSYLSLVMQVSDASTSVNLLEKAPISEFKAKDIFRASGLPILGRDNFHVKKDVKAIEAGEKMTPILLVRAHAHLIIADGYHRMCAVYTYNEDAVIRCKIV